MSKTKRFNPFANYYFETGRGVVTNTYFLSKTALNVAVGQVETLTEYTVPALQEAQLVNLFISLEKDKDAEMNVEIRQPGGSTWTPVKGAFIPGGFMQQPVVVPFKMVSGMSVRMRIFNVQGNPKVYAWLDFIVIDDTK